jgi:hypothetical protein
VDNIKIDLGEIGWGSVDCISLAPDRDIWRVLVNALMKLLALQKAEKFLSSNAADVPLKEGSAPWSWLVKKIVYSISKENN